MTREDFLKQMSVALDGAEVNFETCLEEVEEWDSIAVVSLMSLLHVSTAEIRKSKTVAELYDLVNRA